MRLPDDRAHWSRAVAAIERTRRCRGPAGTCGEVLRADRVVLATLRRRRGGCCWPTPPPPRRLHSPASHSRNEITPSRCSPLRFPPWRGRGELNYSRSACTGSEPAVRCRLLDESPARGSTPTGLYAPASNGGGDIDPASVPGSRELSPPVSPSKSVAAPRPLSTAGGLRHAFAGAHLGWGFHEDGARSGRVAAERPRPVVTSSGGCQPGRPEVPDRARTGSARPTDAAHPPDTGPHLCGSVDIDDPPDHGVLAASGRATTSSGLHLAAHGGVERFVTASGRIDPARGTRPHATNPRDSDVFNLLTTHYCLGPDERLRWLILEIHNTYGEARTLPISTRSRAAARSPKGSSGVSPFISVDGMYDVAVTLTQNG